MATLQFLQTQPFSLAGSGASIGDTTIVLQSMVGIDGSTIVTADLGNICYGTLEPGNGTQEEAFSFTGVTQNANGTATLTGVKTVGFKYPYTTASGLAKTHAGASKVIISNDAGFYANILSYIDTSLSSGAVPATTSVNGIARLSVAPVAAPTPIVVGDNDPRVPTTDMTNALASGGVFGQPSSTNKYITQAYNSSASGIPIVNVYSTGTTWTKPSGLKYVVVEVVGGGGGGGGVAGNQYGCGSGGGGGGYSKKRVATATLGATETVVVGAGGTGSATTGQTGATSSFGAHLSATGGGGGGQNGSGGGGGVGSGGDVNVSGGPGGAGSQSSTSSFANNYTGSGGNAVLGGGGVIGTVGNAYGGGGGSINSQTGSHSAYSGFAGANGVVIVTEYYS